MIGSALHKAMTMNKHDLEALLNTHPVLRERQEDRMFIAWMIRAPKRYDPDSGLVIIPFEVLQWFTKKKRTGDLLRSVQEVLPCFEYQNYWAEGNKCRAIKETGLEPFLEEILFHHPAERMYVASMKRMKSYQEERQWREWRKQAQACRWPYPGQQVIADYLHKQSIQPFLTMREETFDAAWNIALARAKHDQGKQLSLLHHWYDIPQTYYFPTGKSPRVFGTVAQFLAKEVRKALFKGCFELDLQNCQLAIIAGILDIPALQNRMKSGVSIWPEMLSYLGIPKHLWSVAKPHLKVALYSTIFGMSHHYVEISLRRDLAEEGISYAGSFINHPIMAAVIQAIIDAKKAIVKNGGMMSAYGWQTWNEGDDINSFLACVVQSYETEIISQCYLVAAREQESDNRTSCCTNMTDSPSNYSEQQQLNRL